MQRELYINGESIFKIGKVVQVEKGLYSRLEKLCK